MKFPFYQPFQDDPDEIECAQVYPPHKITKTLFKETPQE